MIPHPQAETLAFPLADRKQLTKGDIHVPEFNCPELRERLQHFNKGKEAEEIAYYIWKTRQPIWKLIQNRATELLQPWGTHLRLNPDRQNPGQELLDWRAYSIALPPTILSAAVSPNPHIRLLDPSLVPAGPVAQLHVHEGAALPFPLLWSHCLTHALLHIPNYNAPTGFEKNQWNRLLQLAARTRFKLFCDVYQKEAFLENTNLHDLILQNAKEATSDLIPNDPDRLTALLRQRHNITCFNDVWEQDPCYQGQPNPEAQLIHKCFERCNNNASSEFIQHFTSYLRLQTILYRHFVVDPARTGLPAFSESYQHIGAYTPGLYQLSLEALIHEEHPLQLQAVEVRNSQIGMVESLVNAVKDRQDREWGWVFHLLRRPSKDSPPRYRDRWIEHHNLTDKLATWLENHPSHLQWIRGMDLASVELSEPLWIAAPHLRTLRNRLNCVEGPPLGLTIHVGEDFRHIASGLRAIAEPLVWKMVERGDRLGHAIALGLDVKKWAEQNPTIYQPRWERLLDLLYMLDGITRYTLNTPAITPEKLRHDIHQILKDLNMPETTVDSIKCLWEQLGCIDTLRGHLQFPTETTAPQDPALKLLHRYLWDKETQDKAEARIAVKTAPHIDLLTDLQQHLLTDIARWQIAIEVNPSSNLLIYGMEAPLEQPMFRLRPLQQYQNTVVPVALCSDDPISFSTRLADEYAYAWAGLVNGHVAPSYARAWLDEAAATSYRMRFTQALRPQIP